jgi:magnesium transporter
MNFNHMPELGWTLGYPLALLLKVALAAGLLALLLMVALAAGLYAIFKRRSWLC